MIEMGVNLSTFIQNLWHKFADYPVKRQPICFYLAEDFSSTGDFSGDKTGIDVDMDLVKTEEERLQLYQDFNDRLLALRRNNRRMEQKNQRWSMQQAIKQYPGWNELTISNLHSMFIFFNTNTNKMLLGFKDFFNILEGLGDRNTAGLRKIKYDQADVDQDGFINYDEFLTIIYHFDKPQSDHLIGLARQCFDLGERIRFISNLTVGEQLEYGLY